MNTEFTDENVKMGWGVVLGVPALLFLAYIFPMIPGMMEMPLCGAKHFLGCDCPGCGMTGSFVALMHGNIRASIDSHPLGTVVVAWLVYSFGRALTGVVQGRMPARLLSQKYRDVVMYVFLAALILQWVVKLLIRYGLTL